MKLLNFVYLLSVIFLFSVQVNAKSCGPFGTFSSSNYCVACPSSTKKMEYCPGGDFGLTMLRNNFKECSVSYYSKNCLKPKASINFTESIQEVSPFDAFQTPPSTPPYSPPLVATISLGPQIITGEPVSFTKPFKLYAGTPKMDISGESKKGTATVIYSPNPLDVNQYVFDINSYKELKHDDRRARYSRCAVRFEDYIDLNSEISAPRTMVLYATVETPVNYDTTNIGKAGEVWCEFDIKALLVTPHEIMMRKQIWKWYLTKYSDLKNAFNNDVSKAENHYLTTGIVEGRMPNPTFDPVWYLNKYSDLKKTFGSDYTRAAEHWANFGQKECRQGSSLFIPKAYLKKYLDVANHYGKDNCIGAVEHYLTYGYFESRKI